MKKSYKEEISELISKCPFDINTDIQVTGKMPTLASSEFLINREQGDWAEKIILQSINEYFNDCFAVRYGRSETYHLKHNIQYRKDLGQFFTPQIISDLMAEWIIKDHPKTILDPAFGMGIFYFSIYNKLKKPIDFQAYEIDKKIITYIPKNILQKINLHNADYLASPIKHYDAIICNPPYLRFQKFIHRHKILPYLEKLFGHKILGYSNISSIFLLKSIKELSFGGRLAYIMPYEFFNTGYGKDVKKQLIENGLLKQMVIFSNEKEIFAEAITTVCILLCKKDNVLDPIKITKIKTLKEISQINSFENHYQHKIGTHQLPYIEKWTPIINKLFHKFVMPKNLDRVSHFGKFKRGIANGANEFFMLRKSDIKHLGLSKATYRSCITKSSQLKHYVLNHEILRQLREQDKPVFCFNTIYAEDEAVKNYIACGEAREFHKRYLTRNRHPWFRIEKRTPALILAGVFNRGKLKFVFNQTRAINFTCFHSFYPNDEGEQYIHRLFLYFISEYGQNIVSLNQRGYGNNLVKFEPGDLNECSVPSKRVFDSMSEDSAKDLIHALTNNKEKILKKINCLFKDYNIY